MTNIPVKFRVARINEAIEALREDFANYIKDTSYSIEDRWQVFKDAPDQLSENEPFIHEFDNQYAKMYVETMGDGNNYRGNQVSTVKLVDTMIPEGIDWRGDEYKVINTKDDWKRISELLNPLREEILQKNIKSFVYDW